jgi:hypothetical protein
MAAPLPRLPRATKAQGIEQAIVLNVTASYLRGDALDHGYHEHPQCVELVDSPK